MLTVLGWPRGLLATSVYSDSIVNGFVSLILKARSTGRCGGQQGS